MVDAPMRLALPLKLRIWLVPLATLLAFAAGLLLATLHWDPATMLLAGGGAAVLLALLAWWPVRHLGEQLGADPQAAIAAIRRLASGDLTQRPGHDGLMGELAQLQTALVAVLGAVRKASEQLLRVVAPFPADAPPPHDPAWLAETGQGLEAIATALQQAAIRVDHLHRVSEAASSFTLDGARSLQEVAGHLARFQQDLERLTGIAAALHDNAFQTHALAQKAVVEAGRAGEPAFGQLAHEVHQLALRAARSALEMKDLLAAAWPGGETPVRVAQAATRMKSLESAVQEMTASLPPLAAAARAHAARSADLQAALREHAPRVEADARRAAAAHRAVREVQSRAVGIADAVARFKLPEKLQAEALEPGTGYVPDDPRVTTQPAPLGPT